MAITRDQTATGIGGSGAGPFTITWPANPAAGSKVLVYVSIGGGPAAQVIASVKDNGATQSTFTLDATETDNNGDFSNVYRADNITLPATGNYQVTVTVSPASTTFYNMGGRSYTGVAAGAPTATNVNSGTGTSVTTGNVTPAVVGALVVGKYQTDSGANPATSTLTTSGANQIYFRSNGVTDNVGAAADNIVTSTSAQGLAWTIDSSSWDAVVAVYAPAPTATAGLAHATGAAPGPSAAVTANAGLAVGTGGAPSSGNDQILDTAGQVIEDTSSLAILDTSVTYPITPVDIIPTAALAAGTGIARNVSVASGVTVAPATGRAQPPVPSVTVNAALAHATGTALQLPALGGLAHATGTALAPVPVIALTAGTAPGTGTAQHATSKVLRNPLNLGAVLNESTPNSTVTEASYSATFSYQRYGATLGLQNFGATLTGWTMQQGTLTLSEFNDVTVAIAVTNNGAAYNLTGVTLNLLLKSAPGTPDTSALVFSSAGGSPAITVTNAAGGLATAVIPNTDLDAENYSFFRLDVVSSGLTNTTLYGAITWITL